MNEPPDSGAVGIEGGALLHPNRESLEFIAHEEFHDFGLGYSHFNRPEGVFDDPCDIMSALSSTGFNKPANKPVFSQRGPSLNAFGRNQLDWLNQGDVYWFDETFTRNQSKQINYLRPLLSDGRIAMTRPEKPNDPDQAYRAVEHT